MKLKLLAFLTGVLDVIVISTIAAILLSILI